MIALFFDTETTGFKSSTFTPEIVQIGAILQDTESLRVLAELNMIVKATKPIPPEVTAIHGITDELSQKFGVRTGFVDNMFALLASNADVIVAHNIEFDVGIVNGVWDISRAIIATKEQYCTMKSATDVVGIPKSHAGGNKYPKLAEAYKYFFNKEFANAHDAMSDVRACRDVYFALMAHEAAA